MNDHTLRQRSHWFNYQT